jgi:hypothetical protein
MAQRFYDIAGIRYLVCCEDNVMYSDDRQLTPFRTEPGPWDQRITFHVVDTLPEPAGQPLYQDPGRRVYPLADGIAAYDGSETAYMLLELRQGETTALVRRSSIPHRITITLVLEALFLPKALISRGSFILHSSYIRHNDRAILFTAPSGTGKSTQADLWEKHRGATIINGDRTAVMPTEKGVLVHGIPFCGSSKICKNVTTELSAIVVLSQAPQTTISRLTGLRAFRQVWEGCTVDLWDRKETTVCTDLVLEALRQVPVFHLACTPDETAIQAVERAILQLR